MNMFAREMFRALSFATTLGLVFGLTEGLLDLWSGAAIASSWLPSNFRLAWHIKAAYVAFVTSLYVLLFQAAILLLSLLLMVAQPHEHSSRKLLVYQIFFILMTGLLVFAGINDALFAEVEIVPILKVLGIYGVLVGIWLWQVRRLSKKVQDLQEPSPERKYETWGGTWLFLLFLSLIIPDVVTTLDFVWARGVLLAGALVLVWPISSLIALPLGFRKDRVRNATGAHMTFTALLMMGVPLVVMLLLFAKSTEENLLEDFFSRRHRTGKASDKPNVIIFLIDMLRADHVGCYGYPLNTTPNIDRFAKEGVLCLNAFSQASWTLPSTVTLFTGLHPSVHGARQFQTSLSDEVKTMAEIFAEHGYATAAFVANPFLKEAYRTNQGFDEYYDDVVSQTYFRTAQKSAALVAKSMGGLEALKLLFARGKYDPFNTKDAAGEEIRWWTEAMGAEKLNAKALDWMADHVGQSCFLYVHYIDVHGPHNPPRPFIGSARTESERAIDLYDGDLRYVDSQINSFLEDLAELGIREKSIIIITSDHGHDFGDHGAWNHGRDLYEEQIEVPLVFLRTEAFPYTTTINEVVGLVDLLPTLLDYLDMENPSVQMDGNSFVSAFHAGAWPDAPQYRYHETDLNVRHRSVRYQNRWKLIRSMPSGVTREQLFDLSTDPKETRNLLETQPEMAIKLGKKLDEEFADFESRTYATSVAEPDERTRELLKSLGYMD